MSIICTGGHGFGHYCKICPLCCIVLTIKLASIDGFSMLCKHGAYVDLSVFRCGKIATKLKNKMNFIPLMIIC